MQEEIEKMSDEELLDILTENSVEDPLCSIDNQKIVDDLYIKARQELIKRLKNNSVKEHKKELIYKLEDVLYDEDDGRDEYFQGFNKGILYALDLINNIGNKYE